MIARLLAWMQTREQRRLRAQQIRALEDAILILQGHLILIDLHCPDAQRFVMRLEADALIRIGEEALATLRERA